MIQIMVRKMNILVILKQIPCVQEQEFYQDTGFLNDSDMNVIAEALDLRDCYGGKVTVMMIGPSNSLSVLKEAYTYGIDEAVLLNDEEWNYTDIRVAGRVAAAAAVYTGPYDLIMFGRQAIDGDSAHMAAMTACYLQLPLIPYADGIFIEKGQIIAESVGDLQNEQLSAALPAIVLSIRKRAGRYPSVSDILNAYNGTYTVRIIDGDELISAKQEKMVLLHHLYTPQLVKQHNPTVFKGFDEEKLAEKLEEVICRIMI